VNFKKGNTDFQAGEGMRFCECESGACDFANAKVGHAILQMLAAYGFVNALKQSCRAGSWQQKTRSEFQ